SLRFARNGLRLDLQSVRARKDLMAGQCGRGRSRAGQELSTRNFATSHLEVNRQAALEEYTGFSSDLTSLLRALTELGVSDAKQLGKGRRSFGCEIFVGPKMCFDDLGRGFFRIIDHGF